jgi:hypothetical protein
MPKTSRLEPINQFLPRFSHSSWLILISLLGQSRPHKARGFTSPGPLERGKGVLEKVSDIFSLEDNDV